MAKKRKADSLETTDISAQGENEKEQKKQSPGKTATAQDAKSTKASTSTEKPSPSKSKRKDSKEREVTLESTNASEEKNDASSSKAVKTKRKNNAKKSDEALSTENDAEEREKAKTRSKAKISPATQSVEKAALDETQDALDDTQDEIAENLKRPPSAATMASLYAPTKKLSFVLKADEAEDGVQSVHASFGTSAVPSTDEDKTSESSNAAQNTPKLLPSWLNAREAGDGEDEQLEAVSPRSAQDFSQDPFAIRGEAKFPFRIIGNVHHRGAKLRCIDKALPSYLNISDPIERERAHITAHCEHVLVLIKDWLDKLEHIENYPPSPNLLSPRQYRLEIFENIFSTNFARAEAHDFLLPDQRLAQKYGLHMRELIVLWIVASLHIDPDVRKFMAPITPYGQLIYVNPALILRMLSETQEEQILYHSILSASSRLLSTGLLSSVLYKRPTLMLYNELVVAEQVLKLFIGYPSISVEIAEYAELLAPRISEDIFLAPYHVETLTILENYMRRPSLATLQGMDASNLNIFPSLAFFVEGLPGSGRSTLVKIIASRLEHAVIIVNCSPLMYLDVVSFEDYLKALFLDAEVLGCIICMRNAGPMLNDARMASSLTERLAKHSVAVALCIDLAQTTHSCLDPYITFKTKIDTDLKENAIAYWKPHVQLPNIDQSRIDLKKLTDKLSLQPFQIQKAAKLAYFSSASNEDSDGVLISNEALEKAASAQVSKNIGGLAFISDPEVSLADVIVNNDIDAKLRQIIGSAKQRRRVLYDWGIGKRIRRGTGIIALFDGEPGTGKTHSAEAICRELGLSLMRINIASMVDKYIGETEKNLTTIFEQARPDMSLLLFDEADSLFTKRTSSVSRSTDRYSNMSINVLLQLIERYEGVSVLTTNLKTAIDPAFERRITYKVYFPMPKEAERKRLWKYLCPPYIKTEEEIDYDWLSELELSGGEIKNAVLTAAYKAATLGQYLDNDLLYDAGVSEAVAAGRVTRRNTDDLPPNPIFD